MELTQEIGLRMNDNELQEAARRLAFFAPSEGRQYVEELFAFLAEQAVATLSEGNWPARQVHEKLRDLIGITVEYEEVVAGLERLVHSDRIGCTSANVWDPDVLFFISHSRRIEVLRQSSDQNALEQRVLDQWKYEVAEAYPLLTSDEIEMMQVDLRHYVYRLASQNSVESLLLYYSGQSVLDELARQLQVESIEQILPARPEGLSRAREEMLPAFFRTQDEERKHYIDGLLQSTFILHMIQLDADCSGLVQIEISGGTLYLDTNFIFRLLGLHSPELFFAARQLVELSQKLNYELVYTPVTREEYLHALKDHLRSLKQAPQLPTDILRQVISVSDQDDPIIAYYRKLAEVEEETSHRVFVSPETYYDYFQEIDGLLEPYGIRLCDESCAEIREAEPELSAEASQLKRFADERHNSRSSAYYRELSPFVAEHDAFHRLLILRLRKGQDGGNFAEIAHWFLTCDSKLPPYDRVRRSAEGLNTPFCVLSAQWLQTIRPFSPRMTPDAIVDSLSSSLLQSYTPIPNSIVREVAGRLQLHRGYTPVLGKMAMRRQYLLQFASAREEREKEELIDNLFVEYAEEMERLKDEAESGRTRVEEQLKSVQDELRDTRERQTVTEEELSGLRKQYEEAAQTKQQQQAEIRQKDKELEEKEDTLSQMSQDLSAVSRNVEQIMKTNEQEQRQREVEKRERLQRLTKIKRTIMGVLLIVGLLGVVALMYSQGVGLIETAAAAGLLILGIAFYFAEYVRNAIILTLLGIVVFVYTVIQDSQAILWILPMVWEIVTFGIDYRFKIEDIEPNTASTTT